MIKKKRKDVNYTGYTFNRDNENMKDGFIQALEILEVVKKILKIKKEIMMMIIIKKKIKIIEIKLKIIIIEIKEFLLI